MRGLLYAGAAMAAVGSMMAFSVMAQPATPAAAARPPEPLSVITKAAHVDKAKVGGGDCHTAGMLQSDQGPLNTSTYFVECVHRQASALPYAPETHATEQDEAFYVLNGEATMVTGGKVVGKMIEGGTSVHLSAGDVMVIPGGLPHWFKEVPTQISYLLVRRKA